MSTFGSIVATFAFCAVVGLSAACNDACKEKRIKDCCQVHVTKPKCMPLCRYNTTTQEMIEAGLDCADQLEVWMYCAADGNKDNTQCCHSKKLKSTCDVFCRTSAPKICTRPDLKPYVACAVKIESLMQCHKASVTPNQSWSPSKKFALYKC